MRPFGSITFDELGHHDFHGNQFTGGIGGATKPKGSGRSAGTFSTGGMSAKITGTGKDRKITWVDKNGNPVPKAIADRIKAVGTPPGWTNVRLNDNPKAATQVKGTDSKGREQIRMTKTVIEKNAAEKFARLKDFNKVLPKLTAQAEKDMAKGNHVAALVSLIAKTGFRIGSERDTGAEKKAFGASTLTGKHVTVKGDKLTFKFTGKKGVEIEHELKDKNLAKWIKPLAGTSQKLFPQASDGKANTYIKTVTGNSHFKTKDLRTWNGTAVALREIGNRQAKSEKEFKAIQKEVATAVAKHLGNTPSVALASYIDPSVWSKVEKF